MTDEKLLFKTLASNDVKQINNVFEKIYHKYKNYVAFIAANYLNNTEDIDDIIQEVFIEFFENIHKVKTSIKSYLAIMTKNRAIDLYRKNRKMLLSSDLYFNSNNIPKHPLLEDVINELKLTLKAIEVKIILLHLLDDKTFKEIADILSMKEKTVKSCYYRALKKFKEGGRNHENK